MRFLSKLIGTRAIVKKRSQRLEQATACAVETLENRVLLAITWVNRGLASDRFDETFGANAALARGVVDGALLAYDRVITNFNGDPDNNFEVTLSMSSGGTSFGASAGLTAILNGRPTAGTITMGRGNDTNGDGNGDGAGWFLDPTPDESSEFQGNIVNAFAGDATPGGPAAGMGDFYNVVLLEANHLMGLTFNSNLLFQTGGFLTNTGVPDTAEGGGRGFFYTFQGPTIHHLLTSNNGGAGGFDFGAAVHSAGPGVPVTVGTETYIGAQDTGNAVYEFGRRYLVPNSMAMILADSYGYTITMPETFGTMYSSINSTTDQLLIRGGAGTSSDNVNITVAGGQVTVSVDIGDDVPGTGELAGAGNLDAFVSVYNLADIASIRLDLGDGNDVVNISSSLTVPTTILGGAGNDALTGGGGADSIDGSAGTDTITGGPGNDVLNGGAGNDTYVFAGSSSLGSDTISGEVANIDTDTLNFSALGFGASINLGFTTAQVVSSNLTLTLSDATAIENVIGSASSDNIYGNSRNNNLAGNATADTVFGGTGADFISGGSGDDFLGGDAGNDVIIGDDGNDLAYGGTEDDNMYGGWGSDILIGDDGNDVLIGDTGGSGTGTAGADQLIGGAGNDALHGQGGNDTYAFSHAVALGSDTVSSEAANSEIDTLDFSGTTGGVTVNIGLTTAQVLNANLTLTIQEATAIENVNGTGSADTISGNSRNNNISGNSGNDNLSGGTGGDTINGNSGNDNIFGNDGSDWLYGADGNDTAYGGNDDDFVYGGWGADSLIGENGNDQLVGDSGGGGTGTAGNDLLIGGAGNDSVYGEDGSDTLVGDADNDSQYGGNGSDTYQFGGTAALGSDSIFESANLDSDTLDFTNMGFGVIINIGVTFAQAVTSNLTLTLSDTTGIENVLGSNNGADNITGNSRNNSLQGRNGNDTIYGLGGDDFLHGEGGNDTVWAGDGNDQAYGGDGNDSLEGEAGMDSIYGMAGNDTMRGGADNDSLFAFDGEADTVDGGLGTDTASFDSGLDSVSNVP